MAQPEYKYRPTFSYKDLMLVADCIATNLRTSLQNGEIDTVRTQQLIGLMRYTREYVATQQRKEQNREAINTGLRQLAMAPVKPSAESLMMELGLVSPETGAPVTQQVYNAESNSGYKSQIDNPELSDDSKYDLVCLIPESLRTEAESIWFLNKGTMIKLQRAMAMATNIKADDI